MAIYDDLFGQFNQAVAQILLTRNDLADVSDVIVQLRLKNSWPARVTCLTSFGSSARNILMQSIVLKNCSTWELFL